MFVRRGRMIASSRRRITRRRRRLCAVATVYDQNLGREPNSGIYQSNFGSSFAGGYEVGAGGGSRTIHALVPTMG